MGSRCPQQSENSISATRGEKPSRYDQSHEKGGPALSQASFLPLLGGNHEFRRSDDQSPTNRTMRVQQRGQAQSTSRRNRCGQVQSTTQPFNNAAKPNRSHRTIDNATRPNQTHRATGAAPKPNSPRGAIGHTVHAAPPATRLARRHRPHAPEPHAHRATDEYPGPGSARSRASPSRARGTHRRARARSPRPRRPAAPRTPARAHASSR